MRTKEARREIIESGSPLQHHSLNQEKLRSGFEGEQRLAGILGISPSRLGQRETPSLEVLMEKDLPLSQAFQQALLPSMAEIAVTRTNDDENKLLTIPQRTANIVSDIERIYKLARGKKLHTEIVDTPPAPILEIQFPTRRERAFYQGLFPFQIFLAKLNQNLHWRNVPETWQVALFNKFFRAYTINLTSCNFTLPSEELLSERVEVYSYILATLATLGQTVPQKHKELVIDDTFTGVLKISKVQLLK